MSDVPELVPDDGTPPADAEPSDAVTAHAGPSAAPADGRAEPVDGAVAGVRARYIELLLNSFERGIVDPDEYTYRLGLLDAATEEAVMRRVVQETAFVGMGRLPSSTVKATPAGDGRSSTRATAPLRSPGIPPGMTEADFDPLTLALLRGSGTRPGRGGGGTGPAKRRWVSIMAVGVIFLVLMIVGIILAASVHPASTGSTGNSGLRATAGAASLVQLLR